MNQPKRLKSGETEVCLFNSDCVDGMKSLPQSSVDVIVTSPPYNLGINYSHYDDNRSKEHYLAWTREWAKAAFGVLNDMGSLFLNIGGSPSNPLLPHEVLLQLSQFFKLQNTIHWIKSITVTTASGAHISAGHFKPINSKRFVNDCHEYIFHLTKHGDKPLDRLGVGVEYADKSNIRRWAATSGRDKRCRGNTWHIPYRTINSREKERPHPATFPVELPAMCIRLHGWRSDLVVMDPFLGIGNTSIAAAECHVARFIGFEIDKQYFRQACKAIERRGDVRTPQNLDVRRHLSMGDAISSGINPYCEKQRSPNGIQNQSGGKRPRGGPSGTRRVSDFIPGDR